ncbi:MAG: secretin and TonB N-terminal domain-containing protein, partial [Candidatus Zixiibacteriota bacterium]
MRKILQRRRWLRWCTLVLGISLPLVTLISVPWGLGEPGPSGKKISALNFQNAEMQSVLSFLADYGEINIVASPAVDISVTLSLQDVTWRQALDILLKTYSLTGVEENG